VASRAPTLLSSSWPESGVVGALLTLEIPLTKVPSVRNSSTSADAVNPEGQAVVVPHFGCVVRGAGPMLLSVRPPGIVPWVASANPAVTRPAPAIMPIVASSRVARRMVLAVRHLAAASCRAPEIV